MAEKKIFFYCVKVVIALFVLLVGYLYKGVPMLASLLVGYFFIWRAIKKHEMHKMMQEVMQEQNTEDEN